MRCMIQVSATISSELGDSPRPRAEARAQRIGRRSRRDGARWRAVGLCLPALQPPGHGASATTSTANAKSSLAPLPNPSS